MCIRDSSLSCIRAPAAAAAAAEPRSGAPPSSSSENNSISTPRSRWFVAPSSSPSIDRAFTGPQMLAPPGTEMSGL
eukprot:3049273-Rhodomonas_salina.1